MFDLINELIIIAAVVAVILGAWAVFFITVSVRERQPIQPFVAVAPPVDPQLTPYTLAMNELAEDLGLIPLGDMKHSKGGTYKLTGSIWMSPGQDILVLIAGGTLAKMKYRKTLLLTMETDGTCHVTSDDFAEADLSGLYCRETVLNGGLHELLARHEDHLQAEEVIAQPFNPHEGLGEYAKIQRARMRRLIEQGYARPIDPGETLFCYTLRGAVRLFFMTFSPAKWGEYNRQSDRMKMPRPGDPRWVRPVIARHTDTDPDTADTADESDDEERTA